MSKNLTNALEWLWTPSELSGNAPAIWIWRVRLVILPIDLFGLVLTPVAFLLAAFLNSQRYAAVGLLALAIILGSAAIRESLGISCALYRRGWKGWKGDTIWRDARPVRYWTHTAMHAASLTIRSGAALLLVFFGVNALGAR